MVWDTGTMDALTVAIAGVAGLALGFLAAQVLAGRARSVQAAQLAEARAALDIAESRRADMQGALDFARQAEAVVRAEAAAAATDAAVARQ
jgi:uncharacterized membrane-anchored protein YhcB (DUF1043 family)